MWKKRTSAKYGVEFGVVLAAKVYTRVCIATENQDVKFVLIDVIAVGAI